jgi:hypothetical protein
MKCRVLLAALGAGLLMCGASRAAIMDTMDTAANFHNPFGGETATANGDGTVTILRNTAGVDAGINWVPNGQNIPILGNEDLTVTPVAAVNGGFWVPTILFFNATGNFLGEKTWLGDTNTTQPQTLDVQQLAITDGLPTAAQYFLRLRMDPFNTAGAGFTYTEIDTAAAVVPEPASLSLIGAAGMLLAARRRRA